MLASLKEQRPHQPKAHPLEHVCRWLVSRAVDAHQGSLVAVLDRVPRTGQRRAEGRARDTQHRLPVSAGPLQPGLNLGNCARDITALNRLHCEGGGIRSWPRSLSAPQCGDSVGKVPCRQKDKCLPCCHRPGCAIQVVRCRAWCLCPCGAIVSLVQTSGPAADKTEHPMTWQWLVIQPSDEPVTIMTNKARGASLCRG